MTFEKIDTHVMYEVDGGAQQNQNATPLPKGVHIQRIDDQGAVRISPERERALEFCNGTTGQGIQGIDIRTKAATYGDCMKKLGQLQ